MTKISRRTEILVHQLRDMRVNLKVHQKPHMRTALARIHKTQRDRHGRDWATQLIMRKLQQW